MTLSMPVDISVVLLLSSWGDDERRTVDSALDQTMPDDRMEVIAVIDHIDREMKDYLDSRGIKTIYSRDPALGAMVSSGIENSTARTVTFLEGGDIFTRDRAEQVSDLIEEDDRNVYHHASIEPLDLGAGSPAFRNIDYDLYTNQDDVPFAYSQIMGMNAARHLSAITVRKSAVDGYLNLLHNIQHSADLAVLAICLEHGGRFMFDTAVRVKCKITNPPAEGIDQEEWTVRTERKFHEARIEDMDRLELVLKQQRALDVPRAEKIFSKLALTFFPDYDGKGLKAIRLMHYIAIGMFEHFKMIRHWAWIGLVGKLSGNYARRKFARTLYREPWNLRM